MSLDAVTHPRPHRPAHDQPLHATTEPSSPWRAMCGAGRGAISGRLHGRCSLGALPAGQRVDGHARGDQRTGSHVITMLLVLPELPPLLQAHPHPRVAAERRSSWSLDAQASCDAPSCNLEDENDWGVAKIDQFSQEVSSSTCYACTECARCTNFCPAYNTDKPLSPMHLIMDLHAEHDGARGAGAGPAQPQAVAPSTTSEGGQPAQEDSPVRRQIAAIETQLAEMPPLIGGRIKEETLWACTTCGACQQVCPVFIKQPMKPSSTNEAPTWR